MTEPDRPKRRPGRPKSDTPPPPGHNVPMSGDRWERLGVMAKAINSDRTKVLNAFAAWFTHEPGAKRPNRPAPPPEGWAEHVRHIDVDDIDYAPRDCVVCARRPAPPKEKP